jgi:hypothetical protein
MDKQTLYDAPEIIYEGDLEVQAGSPVGLPELPGLDETDF